MLRVLLSLGLITSLLVSASAFAASLSAGGSAHKDDAAKTAASQKPKVRARLAAEHLALSSKRVSCTLEPVAAANEKPATVASVVESLPPGKKLYLVFKDFRTNAQPGVLYTAYLNLPEKAPIEMAREHAIGIINFFNATVSPDPTEAKKSGRFVSFDVTKLAKKLRSNGRLKDKAVLTLVPAGVTAADSKPIIGEVTLVEQ